MAVEQIRMVRKELSKTVKPREKRPKETFKLVVFLKMIICSLLFLNHVHDREQQIQVKRRRKLLLNLQSEQANEHTQTLLLAEKSYIWANHSMLGDLRP